jgi:hypothetical protein
MTTVEYQNGGVFEGTFVDGNKNSGNYKWPDGSTYVGAF